MSNNILGANNAVQSNNNNTALQHVSASSSATNNGVSAEVSAMILNSYVQASEKKEYSIKG